MSDDHDRSGFPPPPSWAPPGSQPPAPSAPPPPPQQPPQQAGFGPPPYAPTTWAPYGYAPVQQRANGLAIASMVLGIVWIYWIGSVLAVIFGHVALSQIKQSNNTQTGGGMAIAGLVLGYLGLAMLALVIVFAAAPDSTTTFGS